MQCACACCRCHQLEPSNQTGIGENQLASYSNNAFGSPTDRINKALDSWWVLLMTPAIAGGLHQATDTLDRTITMHAAASAASAICTTFTSAAVLVPMR